MSSAADFHDAYVHFLGMFPTLLSLGSGDPPSAWKAELDRIAPEAFDAVTLTNINLEGGAMSGVLNFRQRTLIRALYAVRAARDPAYTNPYDTPAPDQRPPQRIGSVVTLESTGLPATRFS